MFIEKLKESPGDKAIAIITIISFLIFILINQLIFAPLSALDSDYGILDFEFAWTTEQIHVIFNDWGEEIIIQQALGVYWDFLFILGYAPFIFGCILLVTRRLKGKFQRIGIFLSLTPIVAGVLDLIENMNLLVMLNNPTSFFPYIPFVVALCATIKFSFLIIGILFFFAALIGLIISKIRGTDK